MSEKKKLSPNIRERAMFLISPERGEKMFVNRLRNEAARTGGPKMAASYYGRHGASRSLNSMIGWVTGGGAAEDDIDVHGATLRKRARDLYAGGGLARSAPNTLTTNVVGWGITPKPTIDNELLNLSDDQRDEWERKTLREFQLWADSVMCDAERQQTFYGLQQLAFLSMLVSGDCFCVFGTKANKQNPYETVLRLLEADRIATPGSNGESESKAEADGGRTIDGVRISRDGEVVAYYVANRHPLAQEDATAIEYQRIDCYGKETGMPNILHITTRERPEQRRGVPFVAANIENIKQFDRYMTSELAAQVVSSMLTAFIISSEDGSSTGLEDAVDEDEKVTNDDLHLELQPGAIYDLPPGKTIKEINPIRQNTAFESFVSTMETIIGASMEIPKEVLIKKYDSNYTAARSSLLDFWKTVRVHRARFNTMFNQPVYEAWLAEAVALGRVEAPGFFDDPAIRRAWCGCAWTGITMGHVDPKKEIQAAELRIRNNLTTEEQEAMEYNGNNWREVIRQRKKEIEAMDGLTPREPSPDSGGGSEEDET